MRERGAALRSQATGLGYGRPSAGECFDAISDNGPNQIAHQSSSDLSLNSIELALRDLVIIQVLSVNI